MLRLPKFEVEEPTTVAEVVAALDKHGDRARLMAGGTDLMPNMKHEIESPDVVIGLWRVEALRGVRADGPVIRIGAITTLHDLASDPIVTQHLPSLARAASQVAGPQLRRMGTIGGNVCLDTRCVYINQSYFWRQALGFCIKKDGSVCHVVAGGSRCVAAASNDTGPVLMSLGATLILTSPSGQREVAIDDFYTTDGKYNQVRASDELLTEIRIPKPKANTIMGYEKLRTRAAIDFPELGVAVLAELSGDDIVERLDICITALGARPVHVKRLEPIYAGRRLDDALIADLAAAAHKRSKPLTNIASDPSYRREMVPVFVKRAFKAALAGA